MDDRRDELECCRVCRHPNCGQDLCENAEQEINRKMIDFLSYKKEANDANL
jgi:hypothetical protein